MPRARTTRTPTVRSSSSTAPLHFGSRLQIRKRPARRMSLSPAKPRSACITKALSGRIVVPST